MTASDDDLRIDWKAIGAGLDPDARISRDLIESIDETIVGVNNFGLFELVTKMIDGVSRLEQRVLDLERAAKL